MHKNRLWRLSSLLQSLLPLTAPVVAFTTIMGLFAVVL